MHVWEYNLNIYIYIYVCVCVCVCVYMQVHCVNSNAKGGETLNEV